MLTEFEDQYIDVLQNIEWALLSLVKDHPELSDHDMLRIIEQALTYYKSQQRGNLAIAQRLPPPDKQIACNPITIEELILCLKRIEKSIKFWTKQGGRKGYINFAAPRALVSC